MKKHSVQCLGLGVVLSFGLFGVGCSSDSSSPADAGKKDGSAGKDGGNGGSGGSAGSTGVGGSASGGSATGGSVGNGGAIGTGGSSSSGTGGTGGIIVGGSSGTGGSATGGSSGTGGSGAIDGGSVDGGGSDALDAPIGGNDAAIDSGSVDTGTVTVLDSGALDVSLDAPAIDTSLVSLDAGIDMTAVDMSGIDGGNLIPCSEVKIIPAGTQSTGYFGTKENFCFATCDDIAGWGVSNFEGRTLLLINGKEVSISSAGSMPLPTPKVMGTYTVFQVNGSDTAVTYASIYWWGTAATSCAAPTGGFGLN